MPVDHIALVWLCAPGLAASGVATAVSLRRHRAQLQLVVRVEDRRDGFGAEALVVDLEGALVLGCASVGHGVVLHDGWLAWDLVDEAFVVVIARIWLRAVANGGVTRDIVLG